MANNHLAFIRKLIEAGGEQLALSNGPYEVLRFRTKYGVGVVYATKRGGETWNAEAQQARDHLLKPNSGSLSPVLVKRRAKNAKVMIEVQTLRQRDGDECFFCLETLGTDITREHLVPIAHGGPDHLSNKFLAHSGCNGRAGHMSAVEKIKIREANLWSKWSSENNDHPGA